MTTKFNQGMYAKMRGKKNEPLSSIRKRMVRVVEKGIFVTPPALFTEPSRTASPASSVEEITPFQKRPWVDDKRKDKVDYHLSTIFDDAGLALARPQESFSVEELKVFSGMPSHEIMGRHIHKLVQVLYLYNFTIFFFFLLLHCPEC